MPFSFTPSTDSSTSPSFGKTSNSNVFSTVPFGSQCMSGQNSSTITFGSPSTIAGGSGTSAQGNLSSILRGGTSSAFKSSSTSPFGQPSKLNGSAPTNCATSSKDLCETTMFASLLVPQNTFSSNISPHTKYPFSNKTVSPFSTGPKETSSSSTDKTMTDASASEESKHQQKLQCEVMEKKSVELICDDIIRHQEDMKRLIERYRSLELEKMEDTQTIKQLREELAQVTKSKDDIIAEYLESPAFTKRLDEEHEKRLSEIFHPCYVKALRTVHTKLPEMVSPENFPRAAGSSYYAYKKQEKQEYSLQKFFS